MNPPASSFNVRMNAVNTKIGLQPIKCYEHAWPASRKKNEKQNRLKNTKTKPGSVLDLKFETIFCIRTNESKMPELGIQKGTFTQCSMEIFKASSRVFCVGVSDKIRVHYFEWTGHPGDVLVSWKSVGR